MSYCKGCETENGPGEYHDCSFSKYNINGECPCSNCIVKMMCVDACDEYEKWIGIYNKKED